MHREMKGKAGLIRIAAIAVAAGVIMAPQAPVLAKGKPTTSASSASKSKPKASRSNYSKKVTKRKAVRQRTAADVINARAAREHAAHRQNRFQRFRGWVSRNLGRGQTARNAPTTARPGIFARTVTAVRNFFSGIIAKLRRGERASVKLDRLAFENGKYVERPQA
ncbi:MAG: hypothetical protein AAFY81_04025 [Pseudomonadota bacterium]